MNKRQKVNLILNRTSLAALFILTAFSCSETDKFTLERLNYWDKQAEIMTLLGPEKASVFEWVYALDKNAVYTGDELFAVVEKLGKHSKTNGCIKLSIEFDERERVSRHEVYLEDQC